MKWGLIAVLAVVALTGCHGNKGDWPERFETREQVLRYLEAGFDEQYPRLFFDWRPGEPRSRRWLLLEYLGCDWRDAGNIRAAPDGKAFAVENWSPFVAAMERHGEGPDVRWMNILVYSKDENPGLVEVPYASCWTGAGEAFAWKEGAYGGHEWRMRGGWHGELRSPTFDNAGIYFCNGGLYFVVKEWRDGGPLYIYSVDDPNTPLAQCRMKYTDALFTTNDRVYVFGTAADKRMAPSIIEIYRRDGESLTFEREINVPCARYWWFSECMGPVAFDEVNRHVLFVLYHDAIGFPNPYYVYEIDTGNLIKVGKTEGVFLDPDIFKNLPERRPRLGKAVAIGDE
jgi:hypothetical protein